MSRMGAMRSALLGHLLAGHAWFTAGGILLVILLLDAGGALRGRLALSLSRILFLLAIGLALLGTTPVPLSLAVALPLALLGVVATGFRETRARSGRSLGIVAMLLVASALLLEARWHRTPSLARPSRITVLGDSLSSGGFGEAQPWPARLAALLGVEVNNTALPGETVASALEWQVPGLRRDPGALVLLEIGGNDVLGLTTASDFESALDELLAEAKRATPRVAMFELPLPPGKWRFGAVQRRLARKHGVTLIPRRVLARVLADPSLVDDGLHLSDAGHAVLAERVARLFATDEPRQTSSR